MAAKLFMHTPLCLEHGATNRFKDGRLRRLMQFMRTPGSSVPKNIRAYWELLQATHDDPRFYEGRFRFGHKLGIYWETVSPWMLQRTARLSCAREAALPPTGSRHGHASADS